MRKFHRNVLRLYFLFTSIILLSIHLLKILFDGGWVKVLFDGGWVKVLFDGGWAQHINDRHYLLF